MRKALIRPTDAEDAAITAAAQSDQDNLPLTNNELTQFQRGPGRPKNAHKKVQVSIRLDEDLIEAFRADGPGWQTRINEALRKVAPHH